MKGIFFLTLLLFSLIFSPMAEAKKSSESIEPMGMGLAPPIYLVNFLFMYLANPDELGAYMPAYRAALPPEVYECLFNNVDEPEKCSYATMQPFFEAQALNSGGGSRNKNSVWPDGCQTDPRWQRLAPGKYRHPEQLNEPLGMKRAAQLARLLGITDDMLLTDDQYQCMLGTSGDGDKSREIIRLCTQDLSNSNGNTDIPLSSYGLFLGEEENVRSLCAPGAPCLEFNKLFLPDFLPNSTQESLFKIARECGFFENLVRLIAETQLIEFAVQGNECQMDWEPACIVETDCPGNGAQSNNSCQDSLVNDY
jgi:hypothetical protein